MANIGSLEPYDPSQSFQTWWRRFENYCTVNNIPPEPLYENQHFYQNNNRRRALFLHYIGVRCYTILEAACAPDSPDVQPFPILRDILQQRFQPDTLETVNRLQFHARRQRPDESALDFVFALQSLAVSCNFAQQHHEVALRDQIIFGVRSHDTRLKLLQHGGNLTLQDAQAMLIQEEAVLKHAKAIADAANQISATVNKIQSDSGNGNNNSHKYSQRQKSSHNQHKYSQQQKSNFKKNNNSQQHQQSDQQGSTSIPQQQAYSKSQCPRCGGICKKPHKTADCPAWGWDCKFCGIKGHASRVCRKRLHQNSNNNFQSSENSHPVADRIGHLETNQTEQEPSDDFINHVLGIGRVGRVLVDDSPPDMVPIPPPPEFSDQSFVNDVSAASPTQTADSTSSLSGGQSSALHKRAIPSQVLVTIAGVPIQMEVDTGSAVSLMNQQDYLRWLSHVPLLPPSVTLSSVTSPISLIGELVTEVSLLDCNPVKLPLVICAAESLHIPLLGRDWLDEFVPHWRNTFKLNKAPVLFIQSPPSLQELKQKFPNPFNTNSDSCITGFEARLTLKQDAQPVFAKAYPVPFGILAPLSRHLDNLVATGKAVRVTHSSWASPGVCVMKRDGALRFCVDFKRTLNPQLRVDQYPLPRPDDVFAALAQGQVFTSLELSAAYTQLQLHPESQELCTVNTYKGLYRFTRLIYGVASAAALFQQAMDQILHGISGVVCYLDNILVKGVSMSECVSRTSQVLERLDRHNVRLRVDKCEWFRSEVDYLGHVITPEGRRPNPALVEDIVKCPAPSDRKSLKSFLGALNFYHPFLPHLSTASHPLRELSKPEVPLTWSQSAQHAFNKCKNLLTSNQLLTHFDPELPVVLSCDASPVGLGAVLSHLVQCNGTARERPIAFASGSLSPTQQAYSQLDREGLAIIFGIQKFHKFLWGRHFTLQTDNAALHFILHPDKSLSVRASHRLQRWAAFLQGYSYTMVHRKSEFLCHADALSRLPCAIQVPHDRCHAVDLLGLPLTSDMIALETARDPVLQQVFELTHRGWPVSRPAQPELQPYFAVHRRLSLSTKCILMDARVVIPPVFRPQVLKLLHQAHPGVVRTLLLARSFVWWPSLTKDVETQCAACSACTLTNLKSPSETVPWPAASFPFHRIHVDFFQWKQKAFLIIVDAFSKFLRVTLMQKCDADSVIDVFWSVFSFLGFPAIIVSDNGPPFDSQKYIQFGTAIRATLLHSAPYHPQANGMAERAVAVAKKALTKILDFDRPSQETESLPRLLNMFLFYHNTTPSSVTGKSPHEILLSFKCRSHLALLHPCAKAALKAPYLSPFREGDHVAVKFGRLPTVRGVISRQIGSTDFLVNVGGVLKHAHFNQLSRVL